MLNHFLSIEPNGVGEQLKWNIIFVWFFPFIAGISHVIVKDFKMYCEIRIKKSAIFFNFFYLTSMFFGANLAVLCN